MKYNCLSIARNLLAIICLHLLLRPVNAFLTILPPTSSQCGPYTISLNRTHSDWPFPPSTIRLIPVNPADAVTRETLGYPTMNLSVPIVQTIPDSIWNRTSQTGTYTIPELPFRTGEAYIAAMDFGSGVEDEDISPIYQVGPNPAGVSCLTPSSYAAGVSINLTTYQAAQCGPFTVRTQPARAIRAFVLGGSMFNLALPPASGGIMTTSWNVTVAGGHKFVLLYEGVDGRNASSGLIEVIDNGVYGSGCLVVNSSAGYYPTSSGSRINGGAIAGVILAAVAITGLLIYFCKCRNAGLPSCYNI